MANQTKKHFKVKTTGAKEELNRDKTQQDISKPEDFNEDPNSGFADYLKSNQGVEIMRLFVVANSLLVFFTIAWPSIKDTFEIIRDYISASSTENQFEF